MFDRFVVTHFDPATGTGFVRQLTSETDEVFTRPIAFDASHISEVFYGPEDGLGYRIPSAEIAARRPQIGTEFVGSIACVTALWQMAIGASGSPFLRNLAYADQHDAVQYHADSMSELDDYPEDDEEDDEVTPVEVYSRALRCFGGNTELACEAASQYPGDFV
jgi:hypothetical protein